MVVKRIQNTNQNASEWREICQDVVKGSYQTLGDIPKRDLFIGSLISYLEDEQGVYSFFVTCPGELRLQSSSIPFIYLGLSGTVRGERSKGKRTACVDDTFSYLREHYAGQYGIAICGTSPTLSLAETVSKRVIPSSNHRPSNREETVIREFGLQFLHCQAIHSDPSYVLRNVSSSRYTQEEFGRQSNEKYRHDVFDQFKINEREGDRLIVLLQI